MIITERPDIAEQMLAAAAAKHSHADRPTGIHLSDLLVCLARSYYNRMVGTPVSQEPVINLQFMLGEAFHAWLEVQPEHPMLFDGRWQTPDQVETETGILLPVEIKSTRYSSAKGLVDYHLDQLAGYCLGYGVNKGRMVVLYMMGDYGANRQPQFSVADVEFSDAELARWRKHLNYRQELLQHALDTGAPPSLNQRLSWACGTCVYKGLVCPGGKPSEATWGANFTREDNSDEF